MLTGLAFALSLVAFLAAMWGYGWAALRVVGEERRGGIGYAGGVGILVLSILGALINDVGLAYRAGVNVAFGAGILLFLVALGLRLCSGECRSCAVSDLRDASRKPTWWLALTLLTLSAIFVVPSSVLNPHDDLTQYLLRPKMMLQTGTLGSNWFDNTGLDGLGVQSWLQSFFLARLPVTYADAVDDVICLPLCVLLLADLGRLVGATRLQTFVAALALVAINPVQVNVSPKYSLVVMFLTSIIALFLFLTSSLSNTKRVAGWLTHLCIATASLATAVALKTTSLFFSTTAMMILALSTFWLPFTMRDRWRAAIAMIGMSVFLVISYCFPFISQYQAVTSTSRNITANPFQFSDLLTWIKSTFVWSPAQFGQRPFNTTFGFLIDLILTLAAIFVILRSSRDRARLASALTMTIFGLAGLTAYVAAMATTPWGYLRYLAPILTALLPAAVLIGLTPPPHSHRNPSSKSAVSPSLGGTLAISICTAITLLNFSSIDERIGLAWNHHTASVLYSNGLRIYIDTALGLKRKLLIAELQQKIPPGSLILAGILDPIDLDFRRNSGYDVFVAGMGNPWIEDLGGKSPAQIRQWLKKLGVEYLLWQTGGDYVFSRQQLVDAGNTLVSFNAKSVLSFLALYDAAQSGSLGPVIFGDKGYYIIKIGSDVDKAA